MYKLPCQWWSNSPALCLNPTSSSVRKTEGYRISVFLLVPFGVRWPNLKHLLYHCNFIFLDKYHRYIVYFSSSQLRSYFNVSKIVLSSAFLLVL